MTHQIKNDSNQVMTEWLKFTFIFELLLLNVAVEDEFNLSSHQSVQQLPRQYKAVRYQHASDKRTKQTAKQKAQLNFCGIGNYLKFLYIF